jgi:hypothetical protein
VREKEKRTYHLSQQKRSLYSYFFSFGEESRVSEIWAYWGFGF